MKTEWVEKVNIESHGMSNFQITNSERKVI